MASPLARHEAEESWASPLAAVLLAAVKRLCQVLWLLAAESCSSRTLAALVVVRLLDAVPLALEVDDERAGIGAVWAGDDQAVLAAAAVLVRLVQCRRGLAA
jgi:hypothetical protein